MKTLILNTLLAIFLLISFGCEKPAPTSLIEDEQTDAPFEIEVLSQNPGIDMLTGGFDTTGFVQSSPLQKSTVFIGKNIIRDQKNNQSEFNYTNSIFIDKNSPIKTLSGKFLGFKSIEPGVVKFNGITARRIPLKYRYYDRGVLKDTTAGFQFVLQKRNDRINQDPFDIDFNSNVRFELSGLLSPPKLIDIYIPSLIDGKISVTRKDDKIDFILTWLKDNYPDINIVIGAYSKGSQVSVPFFRIRAINNGKLRIPPELIKSIPKDRFDKLIISFIRQIKRTESHLSNEFLVHSQSTLFLVVDLH